MAVQQQCTEGRALGGQTCPAVELQRARSAQPCSLLERLVQKQANGAASMAHGDPHAFPSSAEKLWCSVPKDTSTGGFVFFRVFFFTVRTYPRVHSYGDFDDYSFLLLFCGISCPQNLTNNIFFPATLKKLDRKLKASQLLSSSLQR